jgi:hypothetical protein
VDFPQPLRPIKPTLCPFGTVADAASNKIRPATLYVILLIRIIARDNTPT